MSQAEPAGIRMFLAEAIGRESKDLVGRTTEHFGLSRQTIHKHLAEMVAEGIVEATGRTSGRTYTLKTLADFEKQFSISEHPREDLAWREFFAAPLSGLPENIRQICQHGVTEMFNNAIEHSSGATIRIGLHRTYLRNHLCVGDDGVGIFKKIKDGLKLNDEREAILELAKGKVTTDPVAHSGEGVFFTTRMFDSFSLLANGLFFCHEASGDDWLIESRAGTLQGTFVQMEIDSTTTRTAKGVFDEFSSGGENVPAFDRTHVPVKLLLVGEENLVSRSQAKRLLARFARFKEVMLDFDGVNNIGQAFADEIFRVFKSQNPTIKIMLLRENAEVAAMIQRVLSQDQPPSPPLSALPK